MLNWFKRLVYRIFPGFAQASSSFGIYPIAKVPSYGATQPLFLSEIPQNYTHLLIECQLRVNMPPSSPAVPFAGVSIKFNLNGLSYQYHAQSIYSKNGQISVVPSESSSWIGNAVTNGAVLNEHSSFFIFIPNYANPEFAKKAIISSSYQQGYGANGFTMFGMGEVVVSHTKSDPVTMVTITPDNWIDGYHFDSRSYMKVFGIKDGLDS